MLVEPQHPFQGNVTLPNLPAGPERSAQKIYRYSLSPVHDP